MVYSRRVVVTSRYMLRWGIMQYNGASSVLHVCLLLGISFSDVKLSTIYDVTL